MFIFFLLKKFFFQINDFEEAIFSSLLKDILDPESSFSELAVAFLANLTRENETACLAFLNVKINLSSFIFF